MSILIQAGHFSSCSDVLMQKLYERGLGQPFNSFTHDMSSQQIADKLYKIVTREGISISNSKLADNVMIDLLLSNLETQDWGWSAEKNLFTMDLWQQLESEVKLILVFDHPRYFVDQLVGTDLTVSIVDQAMSEWVNYHQKMLEILEDYADKTILIEGSCAVDNIGKLGEQIKSIANSLQLKSYWQVSGKRSDTNTNSNIDAVNQSYAAKDHISNEILKKYPKVFKLFNTLLSKATIKNSEPIYKSKDADLAELIIASNCLNTNQINNNHDSLKKELKEAILAQQESEERIAAYQKTIDNYKYKLEQILKESKISVKSIDINSDLEILKQEKKVLVNQLHHTQDELEKYYYKNKLLESNVSSENKNILHPKNPTYYGAADRVKNELAYRVGEKMVKAKRTKDIVILPLTLVGEYRKYNLEKKHIDNLPDIEEYIDFKEVEKVKKHLSYRVGDLVLNTSKSPKSLFLMPFKIGKEVIEFKNKK